MAEKLSRFQMRIAERRRLQWEKAAEERGQTLSKFVELAVEKEIGARPQSDLEPAPEETRHLELLARLDKLAREVTTLRLGQTPPAP